MANKKENNSSEADKSSFAASMEQAEQIISEVMNSKKNSKKSKNKEDSNKEVDRDENGLPTYKGTMDLPEMNQKEKRAFEAVIFKGTQESDDVVLPHVNTEDEEPKTNKRDRVLPQTESKSDHLLIKGLKISKEMKSGEWIISEIETNKGSFSVGPRQNDRINQHSVMNLVLHLREVFEEDLKVFLDEEED